jgi:hypothetical protein
MSTSIEISLVTANFGRGVKEAEARDNMERLHAQAPGAFIGFQEINEANPGVDRADLILTEITPPPHAALGDDYTFVALQEGPPWKKATPIAVPPSWEVLSHSVNKTSDGVAKGTPNRVVVTARCRPVGHPDFPPVLFLNGHYPLDHSKKHPDLNPQLKQAWKDCQAAWVRRVKKLHEDSGLTILTTRDSNHGKGMPKLHPDEKQFLDDGLIDRISVIPAEPDSTNRVTVTVIDEPPPINLTIDGHNAHVVRLRLTAA